MKWATEGGNGVPVGIVFDEIDGEGRFRGFFLVAGFEAADFADRVGLEGEVVLVLGLRIGVLDYNIDGFSDIAFLKVDISKEIDVTEDCWGLEAVWEDLLG